MAYNTLNRRLFLRGVGGFTLSLPVLPSLIPSSARAAIEDVPLRFVQIGTEAGVPPERWYNPIGIAQMTKVNNSLFYKRLSDISGSFSPIIHSDIGGPSFANLKNKINVIRGLDYTCSSGNHNSGAFATGSVGIDQEPVTRAQFKLSADFAIGQSKYIYKAGQKIPRVKNLVTGVQDWLCFSYHLGTAPVVPNIDPVQVFRSLFSLPTQDTMATVDARTGMQKKAVDLVFEDYRRTKNSRQISSEDKPRLEAFMQYLSSIQDQLKIPVNASLCPNPKEPTSPTNIIQKYQNLIKVVVAALACQEVRSVSMTLHDGVDSFSQYPEGSWHDLYFHYHGDPASHLDVFTSWCKWRASRLADMLTQMDAIQESNGLTLLDNSIVHYGSEFGGKGEHMYFDVPVIVAGGAQGKLNTGYYIDYRQRDSNGNFLYPASYYGALKGHYGRPYNQVFTTYFNAIGVPALPFSDGGYLQPGNPQGAFGDYLDPYQDPDPGMALYKATSATYSPFTGSVGLRQMSLPFLSKA